MNKLMDWVAEPQPDSSEAKGRAGAATFLIAIIALGIGAVFGEAAAFLVVVAPAVLYICVKGMFQCL